MGSLLFLFGLLLATGFGRTVVHSPTDLAPTNEDRPRTTARPHKKVEGSSLLAGRPQPIARPHKGKLQNASNSSLFKGSSLLDVNQSPVPCANEGGSCSIGSGPQVVQYGYNGQYSVLIAEGTTVPCNNDVFSDSSYGNGKECSVSPLNTGNAGLTTSWWTTFGSENTDWDLSCVSWVRFGYGSSWTYKLAFGYVSCSNSWFNFDPSYGNGKSCQSNYCSSASLTFCGEEGTICDLTTSSTFAKYVLYTSNSQPTFSNTVGSEVRIFAGENNVGCNNDVFGGDPSYGNKKYCYYSPVSAPFINPTGAWLLAGEAFGGQGSVSLTVSLQRSSTTQKTSTWTTTLSQEFSTDFGFGGTKTTVSISDAESTSLSNTLATGSSQTCGATCPASNPYVYQWAWQASEQCTTGLQYCALQQSSCFYACMANAIPPPCPYSACQGPTCATCATWH